MSAPMKGAQRGALGLLFFLLAVVASLWLVIRSTEPRSPEPSGLDPRRIVEESIAEWHAAVARARDSRERLIVLVGDSMLMSNSRMKRDGVSDLPERLDAVLTLRLPAESFAVATLRWGGYDAFGSFFMADEIARSGAELVVVSLNLRSLSRAWTPWIQTHLAGRVAPDRLTSAVFLPLHYASLSADRLLVSVVARNTLGPPMLAAMRQRQEWAALAFKQGAEAFDARFGQSEGDFQAAVMRARRARTLARSAREGVEEEYEAVLAGVRPSHPGLVVLRNAIETWRAAGSRVFVFIAPVNSREWRSLGLDPGPGLARTVKSVERIARQSGADFADFHDLLGPAGFRDSAGHLSFEGAIDGHQELVEALSFELLGSLR